LPVRVGYIRVFFHTPIHLTNQPFCHAGLFQSSQHNEKEFLVVKDI
jgi:hypothetical protein